MTAPEGAELDRMIAYFEEGILLGAAIIAFCHLVRLQVESCCTESTSRETSAQSAT